MLFRSESLYFNPSNHKTTASLYAQNVDPSFNAFGANHGLVQKGRGAYMKGARIRCLFPVEQHGMKLKSPLGIAVDEDSKGQFGKGEVNVSWSTQRKFPLKDGSSNGTYCEYHQVPGHSTETCGALRNKVQDLIEEGKVDLDELRAYHGKRPRMDKKPN